MNEITILFEELLTLCKQEFESHGIDVISDSLDQHGFKFSCANQDVKFIFEIIVVPESETEVEIRISNVGTKVEIPPKN